MSVPNTYLELLQTKVIPNTQTGIKINFNKEPIIVEPISDEKDEKLIQDKEFKSKAVAILDKRRSSTINRDIVLDKLRKQDVFAVKPRPSPAAILDVYIPKELPTPQIIDIETKIDKPVELQETPSTYDEELSVPAEITKPTTEEDVFDIPSERAITPPPAVDKELQTITQLTELKEPAKFETEIQEEKVEEMSSKMKMKLGLYNKKSKKEEVEEEVDFTIIDHKGLEISLPESLNYNDYLNAAKTYAEKDEDAVAIADQFF
ncbi:MAG: hypothetical protein ACO3UU_13645, partial [Minisyncoccia bacterium]